MPTAGPSALLMFVFVCVVTKNVRRNLSRPLVGVRAATAPRRNFGTRFDESRTVKSRTTPPPPTPVSTVAEEASIVLLTFGHLDSWNYMYKQYTRMGVNSKFLDGSFQTLLLLSYVIVRIHEVPLLFTDPTGTKLGHQCDDTAVAWSRHSVARGGFGTHTDVGRAFQSSRVASRRVASRACGSDSWSRC